MSQLELILAIFGVIITIYIFILIIKSLLFKNNKENDIVNKVKKRNQEKALKNNKIEKKEKPLPTMAGTKK